MKSLHLPIFSLLSLFVSCLLLLSLTFPLARNVKAQANGQIGDECTQDSQCGEYDDPIRGNVQLICFPEVDGTGALTGRKTCANPWLVDTGVGSPGVVLDKWWKQNQETYQENLKAGSEGAIGSEIINTHYGFTFLNFLGYASAGDLATVNPSGTADAGAIGAFGNLIAGMTSKPPVQTATYIADLGQNLGFVTPAYAQDQGTGFRALEPVLPLWKAFRNIAYFGFVIIFVVIGFMIMFRTKINPQTVVSIQAALPKIVVTLLLITFSYAIASFVVDLIYLLIYLVIGTFGTFGIIADIGIARDDLLGKNLLGLAFSDLLGPFQSGLAGIASGAVNDIIRDIIGSFKGTIANLVTGPLAYVIFAVAILISIFKLFFQLLLAYIGIIFSVIFAPITLLFNALPGNNGFLNWLKGILANALVFPLTATMFLIAGALIGGGKLGTNPNIGYAAYDYAETQLPLIGSGISTDALTALIGIGFLMMMPKVIELVQKMMGVEGGFVGMMGGAMEGLKAPIAMYQGFRERRTQKDQMELSRRQLIDAGGKPRFGSKAWRLGDIFRP